ncbi:MAG: GAF domain-containing protein [candidate division KSB1 bacterium]|nr:GAF domain-containing protein [candidate division KSB1 bacterium]MDZ7367164.1 GAF domain-containing protein [candidate division KSB1 bacterium]MDZ7405353.1 GAF domain-containing protein [candidate division KSB1 bacterium]
MEDSKKIEALQARLRERIQALAAEIHADTVTMFCYDRESDKFALPLGYGLLDPSSFQKSMPRSDRLAGKIVKENKTIVAETVANHPEINGPFSRREKIQSVAGYPLAKNDITVGVVFVSYRQPHRFKDNDLAAIKRFAQEAAGEIIAAQVLDRLREQSYREQPEEQQVLQGIVEVICSAMDMPAAIWLRDRYDPKRVSIHAATGISADYQERAAVCLDDESIISQVMRTGESIGVKKIGRDPRFKYPDLAARAGWESLLAVPLKVKNHITGAIELFSFEPREFSRTDLEKISVMIGRIGLAIENYRRFQELQIFSQIVQTLGTILEPEKALQEIVDGARNLAKADTAAIFFFAREKGSEKFRLASHSPKPHEYQLPLPRPIGGISRHVIDTGNSVCINDVLNDVRVNQEVIKEGTRSIVGVPVQVGSEKSGVLYVTSKQPYAFADHDVELLRNLAGHAAAALQRVQLLDALRQIERASSRIVEVDNVTQDLLREICGLGFEFGAVQLVDHASGTIATVQGIGIAQAWTGLAKHRLDVDSEARDIQADIAQNLTIEIITGWDPRFDLWIFNQFNHQRLIRIFAPIFLMRDQKGNLDLPTLECYDWEHPEKIQTKNGSVLRFEPSKMLAARQRYDLEVIGTIEAGYQITQRNSIGVEDAKSFFRVICEKARALWETQLNNVLETIVKNAMQLIAADSATIRLLYDPAKERYAFNVCAGKIGPEFLEIYYPKRGRLGDQALRDREPKVLDRDFEASYPDFYHLAELKKLYRDRYKPDEGIRALACFPLIVSETQYGLLYLHYWREHHFSNEELEWGKLFAEQAVSALKNTLVFQEKRQAARALDSLHFVGQFLVSQPQVKVEELLRRIAQSALNVLNADVITVYLYDQQQDNFPLLPPLVEGRLLVVGFPMMGQIERNDAPSRIIRDIRQNIYAPDALQHPIFCDRTRVRPPGKEIPFVDREKIKSAAGILFQVGSEIVGVMFVNYRTRHEFALEERRLIETFASAAAIGIYNARLFNRTDEQLRHRLEELTARVYELQELQEVSTAITYSTLDVKGVLQQIAKGARSVLDADVTVILPYDTASKNFHTNLVAYDGIPGGLEFDDVVTPGGVATSVLGSAEGYLIVDDVESPPHDVDVRPHEGFLQQIRVQSFLGVALRVGTGFGTEGSSDKETVGVLYIDFLHPHKFQKEEIQVAQMFANYAATAIAAARVHERKLEIERVAAINAFGARFAHRVGNLLGTVPVNFNAIQRLLKDSSNPHLKAHLDLLREDVAKIERILEAGKNLRKFGSIHKEAVVMNDILREVLGQQKLPDHVNASLDLDQEVGTLTANKSVLMDILSDMIDNALYAMPNGGHLTLGTKLHRENNMVEIRVSDTGWGIPSDVLQSLQKPLPFFSTKENNLGLGVWLDYQAVQQMGGKLHIESEVNFGTSFIIQLPL